jgi:putative endonuclease
LGYTVVARNWRTPRRRGEIDLVAWDGDVLCFIEVKTRTSRDIKPAEAAVGRAKRREIVAMAREYRRRLRPGITVRFDVVSIYFEAGCEPVCELFKNAYSWRSARQSVTHLMGRG